jgi:hypothetical protein
VPARRPGAISSVHISQSRRKETSHRPDLKKLQCVILQCWLHIGTKVVYEPMGSWSQHLSDEPNQPQSLVVNRAQNAPKFPPAAQFSATNSEATESPDGSVAPQLPGSHPLFRNRPIVPASDACCLVRDAWPDPRHKLIAGDSSNFLLEERTLTSAQFQNSSG